MALRRDLVGFGEGGRFEVERERVSGLSTRLRLPTSSVPRLEVADCLGLSVPLPLLLLAAAAALPLPEAEVDLVFLR